MVQCSRGEHLSSDVDSDEQHAGADSGRCAGLARLVGAGGTSRGFLWLARGYGAQFHWLPSALYRRGGAVMTQDTLPEIVSDYGNRPQQSYRIRCVTGAL